MTRAALTAALGQARTARQREQARRLYLTAPSDGHVGLSVTVPDAVSDRIDEAREDGETRAEFLRTAIGAELERRRLRRRYREVGR